EIGRIKQGGARAVELRHESITETRVRGGLSARRGRGGARRGKHGEIGIAGTIDRDPGASITAAAAEVGRVTAGRARAVELRHEGIIDARVHGLKSARSGREVARRGSPGEIGIAGTIDRDPGANILAAAAEVGGVKQGRARAVELRHESITEIASTSGLKSAW